MSLSNTAIPYYYGRFREAVLNGEIKVCQTISMEMNRIDSLIEDPMIYCDSEAVERWVRFCETELVLTDGSPVTLLDTFKLWGEEVFAWYYFVERSVFVPNPGGRGGRYVTKTVKKRLINEQYLFIPRSAAKTMYDSFIQAYFLTADTSTTHQIATAPTMRQAEEILSPIRTAIVRHPGPFWSFLTYGSIQNTTGNRAYRSKLASTKKGIENLLSNSLLEVRSMSIDKLQGLRVKVATVDELLSCDVRENPVEAISQGAQKVDDYLILVSSSEGTVRNGVGDSVKMSLMDILRGEYENKHVSIWYYQLDSIEEVGDPTCWIKAQPNLGKTVSYETYQMAVEKAEKVPSERNDILAKRFNLPMEGYTYFFPYEDTLPHPKRSYRGMPCSLGADLSKGDDFCSFTFLFPLGRERFGVKTRNYITSSTYSKLPNVLKEAYQEFINEGSLIIMEGVTLEMMEVYEDLDDHIARMNYEINSFGYDPYNATEFVDRWCTENGSFGVEKVIQGIKTESVPLGELKALAGERSLLFDELIMKFAMGNCVAIVDTNGNRKLSKDRRDRKIDCFAALMDAYIAYKRNRDAFE